MGQQKRSLIGHLTLTVIESWELDTHWRNALIVAVVGSIAFMVAEPANQGNAMTSGTQQSNNGLNTTPPSSFSPTATLVPVQSTKPLPPPELKPSLNTDEVNVVIDKEEDKQNSFGRSYGAP